MIFEEEIPVLPPGVLLENSHLLDTVTGDRVQINETAHLMLSLADGRRTAREIGEAVAARYGLGRRRVVSDLLQLVDRLNEKCLLNIETPLRKWRALLPKVVKVLLIEVVVLGHIRLPWHRKRLDFCNESKRIGFLSVVRGLSPSGFLCARQRLDAGVVRELYAELPVGLGSDGPASSSRRSRGVHLGNLGERLLCLALGGGEYQDEAPRMIDGTMEADEGSHRGLATLPASVEEHPIRCGPEEFLLPRIRLEAHSPGELGAVQGQP